MTSELQQSNPNAPKSWRFEVIVRTERLDDAIEFMCDAFGKHPGRNQNAVIPPNGYGFDYEIDWFDPYELSDLEYGN